MRRILVVGAGIVGLAVAREAGIRWPDAAITVVDKEGSVAVHQTGHNSGVIHSGLYYAPGSLKARLCTRGAGLMRSYCAGHGIEVRECGKIVVALTEAELPRLNNLMERGVTNRVPGLRMIGAEELRAIEPHAVGVRAIHSPHTAVVDYGAVSGSLAREVSEHGEVLLGARVVGLRNARGGGVTALLDGCKEESLTCDLLITCAGLQADRVSRMSGDGDDPQIVPFRGDYYRLRPEAQDLVRGLIYPVPDARYPFLGVHLTRTVSGEVLAGPNAVLAYAREGYTWRTVDLGDLRSTLAWPGFRILAKEHWRTGLAEFYRSISKRRFLAAARLYVPELTAADLLPAPAGVRAQAVARDGRLVDDFWISRRGNVLNVRNAPSPAATSCLAIAEYVCTEVGGW